MREIAAADNEQDQKTATLRSPTHNNLESFGNGQLFNNRADLSGALVQLHNINRVKRVFGPMQELEVLALGFMLGSLLLFRRGRVDGCGARACTRASVKHLGKEMEGKEMERID